MTLIIIESIAFRLLCPWAQETVSTRDTTMRDAFHRFLKDKVAELKDQGMVPREALSEARKQFLSLTLDKKTKSFCYTASYV